MYQSVWELVGRHILEGSVAEHLKLARGTSSKLELTDFSVLVGWHDCSMLHTQDGTSSFRANLTQDKNLKTYPKSYWQPVQGLKYRGGMCIFILILIICCCLLMYTLFTLHLNINKSNQINQSKQLFTYREQHAPDNSAADWLSSDAETIPAPVSPPSG